MQNKVRSKNLENVTEHQIHVHCIDDFVVVEIIQFLNLVMFWIIFLPKIFILGHVMHVVEDETIFHFTSFVVVEVTEKRTGECGFATIRNSSDSIKIFILELLILINF